MNEPTTAESIGYLRSPRRADSATLRYAADRLEAAEAQLSDIERELLARCTALPDSKVIKNIIAVLNRNKL